jgi:hypothetical protein
VRPVVVVLLLPVADDDLGVARVQNRRRLRSSSRSRPLKDSMKGFFEGSPGGMKIIPVRVPAHSASAAAIISGPSPHPRRAVITLSLSAPAPIRDRAHDTKCLATVC